MLAAYLSLILSIIIDIRVPFLFDDQKGRQNISQQYRIDIQNIEQVNKNEACLKETAGSVDNISKPKGKLKPNGQFKQINLKRIFKKFMRQVSKGIITVKPERD